MKTAAKFFIIISMIFGFPAIIPLIVGAIALTRLDEAEEASDLTGIAIVTILFCSLIGGILMLCITDEDLCDEDDEDEHEVYEVK